MHSTYIKTAETQQTQLHNIYKNTQLKLLTKNKRRHMTQQNMQSQNYVTSAMYNFGTPWGQHKCIETCRNDYNINIVKIKIYTLSIVGWNKNYQLVRLSSLSSLLLSAETQILLSGIWGFLFIATFRMVLEPRVWWVCQSGRCS